MAEDNQNIEQENVSKFKQLIASGAAQNPYGIRRLPRMDFKDDRSIIEKLPVDMVATNIFVTLEGWFTPEWTSGVPTAHPRGVLDALVEYFKIEASSKTVVKRSPKMLRKVRELNSARMPKAFHKVDSKTLDAATQEDFAFGTTGQSIAVHETIAIPMALFLSITPEATYLDTSRHLQTNFEIQTRSLKALVGGGNAVDFKVNDHDLRFKIHVETSDEDIGKPFLTYRQDYTEETFSGAYKSAKLDIQRPSKMMGLALEVLKIDKSTDAVTVIDIKEATGVKFAILVNGRETRRGQVSLAEAIAQSVIETELIDFDPHVAYLQFAQNGDIDTAEVSSIYNSFELDIDLDGELLDFGTYEYTVRVHFDEVL
jgi:hypothetical protein